MSSDKEKGKFQIERSARNEAPKSQDVIKIKKAQNNETSSTRSKPINKNKK